MSLRHKVQRIWFGNGAGVTSPVPPGGWDRVWFVLKTHYMELIGLNLLFLIFCIPIVTIPAALAGVTSILMKWTRDEPVIFWEDFFQNSKPGF
jgi:hypothetical protein